MERPLGLRLQFNDDSVSYCRLDMTVNEFANELLKWDKDYILESVYEIATKDALILCFDATKRGGND